MEIKEKGMYLYLPTNKIGYSLLEKEIGKEAAIKYRNLFIRKVVRKKSSLEKY